MLFRKCLTAVSMMVIVLLVTAFAMVQANEPNPATVSAVSTAVLSESTTPPIDNFDKPIRGQVVSGEAYMLVRLVTADERLLAETFTDPDGFFSIAPLLNPVAANFEVLTRDKRPLLLTNEVVYAPHQPGRDYRIELALDGRGLPEVDNRSEMQASFSDEHTDELEADAPMTTGNGRTNQSDIVDNGIGELGQHEELDLRATLSGSGSISGTVMGDDIGQGIYAYVRVYTSTEATDPILTRHTNSSGQYEITGLDTGDYYLYFKGDIDYGAIGFRSLTSDYRNYLGEFYDDKKTLAEATPISVISGTNTVLDVSLILGGTIEGTLVGDDSNSGIYGHVNVYTSTESLDSVASTTSNLSGFYEIEGLEPGTYYLEFFGGAYSAEAYFDHYLTEYYSDKLSLSEATPVTVSSGQVETANASLTAGGIISGAITAADTGSATSAYIAVYTTTTATDPIREVYTGFDGLYSIRGLDAGTYYIYARGAQMGYGYEIKTGYLDEYYNDKASLSNADPLAVSLGQTSVINMALSPGGTISGTVTAADNGDELSGSIDLYDSDKNWLSTHSFYNGTYQLTGLITGTYYLKFDSNHYNYIDEYHNNKADLESADPISITAGETTEISAQLDRGGVLEGFVTRADNGDRLTNGGVIAENTVTGVSYYDTYLYDDTLGYGYYKIEGIPTGNYILFFDPTVYSGDTSDLIEEYYNGKSSEEEADPVTITQGVTTTINYALPVGGVVSGTVTAEDTNAPLQSVYVQLQQVDTDCGGWERVDSAYTDASGNYEFEGLHVGDYRVTFETRSWQSGDGKYYLAEEGSTVSVGLGEVTIVSAALARGGQIGGQLVDQDTGTPLEGVVVNVYGSLTLNGDGYYHYPWISSVTTDASGDYTTTALIGGDYYLWFTVPWGAPDATLPFVRKVHSTAGYKFWLADARAISVSEGDLVSIDDSLVRGAQISGRVTAGDGGQPLNDVGVRVFKSPYNNVNAWGRTDANGDYTTPGVPADSNYVVEFETFYGSDHPEYVTEFYDDATTSYDATKFTLSQGELVENVDVVLARGGTISGRINIQDKPNSYLSNIFVVAYDTNGSQASYVFLNSNSGNDYADYEIKGLRAGTYKVFVSDRPIYSQAVCGSVEFYGEYYGGSSTFAAATDVVVTGTNTTTDIDLTMSENNDPVMYPSTPVYVVSGTVQDSSGAGVPDVQIATDTGQLVTTQADGTYQMELSARTYTIIPQKPGHTFTPESREVVMDSDKSGIDFTAVSTPPSGAIRGYVNGETSGRAARIVSVTNPLEGIKVQLFQYYGGAWDFVDVATTDENGFYNISGLYDGDYRLYAVDPHNDWISEYYNDVSLFDLATTIAIVDGSISENINATLAARPEQTVEATGGQVTVDPQTGQVEIPAPRGGSETITITEDVICSDSSRPTAVQLTIGTTSFDMSYSGSGNLFNVTLTSPTDIPAGGGAMVVQATCPSGAQSEGVGQFTLYDPSGLITDAQTGGLITGATVTLYRVPSATPDTATETNDCRTVDTRPSATDGQFGSWSALSAETLSSGNMVNPAVDQSGGTPLFDPAVATQVTGSDGHYGWNVAEGCWFVTVEADGYETAVSPMVGVPPEVTDLNIALQAADKTIYLPLIIR